MFKKKDIKWLIDKKHFSNTVKTFKWRTVKEGIKTLYDMDTAHIFNSMKMYYNAVAPAYGAEKIMDKGYGDIGDDADKYDRLRFAPVIGLFLWAIEKRGDLPFGYRVPYNQMVDQILSIPKFRSECRRKYKSYLSHEGAQTRIARVGPFPAHGEPMQHLKDFMGAEIMYDINGFPTEMYGPNGEYHNFEDDYDEY